MFNTNTLKTTLTGRFCVGLAHGLALVKKFDIMGIW